MASQSKSVAKLSCRLECVVVASLSQKIAQKVYERHNKNSTLYRLNCKQKRHMSCKVLSNFMQMKYMYNTYTYRYYAYLLVLLHNGTYHSQCVPCFCFCSLFFFAKIFEKVFLENIFKKRSKNELQRINKL